MAIKCHFARNVDSYGENSSQPHKLPHLNNKKTRVKCVCCMKELRGTNQQNNAEWIEKENES